MKALLLSDNTDTYIEYENNLKNHLSNAGYGIDKLASGYSVSSLIESNFTLEDIAATNEPVIELVSLSGQYTVQNLSDIGFSATQLKSGGYDATSLVSANIPVAELKTAGFSATELKSANVSASVLTDASFTLTELIKIPEEGVDPDLSVAIGAAIQGATMNGDPNLPVLYQGLTLLNVTSLDFGEEAQKNKQTFIHLMIPKNTPYQKYQLREELVNSVSFHCQFELFSLLLLIELIEILNI
mgnify:CR=1 FL=1